MSYILPIELHTIMQMIQVVKILIVNNEFKAKLIWTEV